MLLSSLIDTFVFSGKTLRGFVRGIGFSQKNGKVKYLFCCIREKGKTPDFALNASRFLQPTIQPQTNSLRPVLPKACAKLFPLMPLYSINGEFLGRLIDAEIENGMLTTLISEHNIRYSFQEIFACADAIILRKKQAYPLGQPIPNLSVKNASAVVTKPLLKNAIKKGKLISFTLSLPPFQSRTKLG